MKERAFRAAAREAKGLHDGSITRVVRPCKKDLWPLLDEIEKVNGHPAWRCMDFDVRCPFDVDRLWVQESFGWIGHVDSGNPPIYEVTDPMDRRRDILYYTDCPDFVWFGADGSWEDSRGRQRSSWRSSTQMPRWATRTLLDVTDVRVVRAREVSEDDAKVTGLLPLWGPARGYDEDQDAGPSFGLALRKFFGEDAWLWLATVAKV